MADGRFEIVAATRSIKELKGVIANCGRTVSIKEMKEAIASAATK